MSVVDVDDVDEADDATTHCSRTRSFHLPTAFQRKSTSADHYEREPHYESDGGDKELIRNDERTEEFPPCPESWT